MVHGGEWLDAPPRLPPTEEGLFLKGQYLLRFETHIPETGHSVVENFSSVRKQHFVAKKKCWRMRTGQITVNRSEFM